MKITIFIAILSCVFGEWTHPVDLYQDSLIFYPKDLYTDPSTGTSHALWCAHQSQYMNYWRITESQAVISRTPIVDPIITSFFAGRIIGPGNGRDLYMLTMGTRGVHDSYDQFLSESHDNGDTWSQFVRPPRDDMDDECDRYGDALLLIKETGRIYLFYQLDCEGQYAKLAFVTRPPGSQVFSRERVVIDNPDHEQIRPSITAEYTIESEKMVLHIVWGEVDNRERRRVMHVRSQDYGLTWSVPGIVSGTDKCAGMWSISSIAGKKEGILMGTYAVSASEKLKLFYSKDNGRNFTVVDSSLNNQQIYIWEYRPNSMAICGGKDRPMLFMLSHTKYDEVEYSIWDLNTMQVERVEVPFSGITIYAGAKLTCYSRDDKTVVINVWVHSLQDDDERYHILFAQDVRTI